MHARYSSLIGKWIAGLDAGGVTHMRLDGGTVVPFVASGEAYSIEGCGKVQVQDLSELAVRIAREGIGEGGMDDRKWMAVAVAAYLRCPFVFSFPCPLHPLNALLRLACALLAGLRRRR